MSDGHCNRPGTCNCGPLGCNCGCYFCDGGPERGLTREEWRAIRKNKIEHLKKLLASGPTDENGYDIRLTLIAMGPDPDEDN